MQLHLDEPASNVRGEFQCAPERRPATPSLLRGPQPSEGGLAHRALRFVGPGDRVRGEPGASLKVLLYGSLADADTRRSYLHLRNAVVGSPHVCFAWRHARSEDPSGDGFARLLEAAAAQGMFWSLCDRVIERDHGLEDVVDDLLGLCLDLDQARIDLLEGVGSARIRSDLDLASRAAPEGAPSLFLNGSVVSIQQGTVRLVGLVDGVLRRVAPVGQRPW